MFEKCRLICLGNDAGKQAWLAGGGDPALVFSANQLKGRLAIGEALPEQLVFDGSLKDCIHIFSEQSIEEGSEQINAYLEQAQPNGQRMAGSSSPAARRCLAAVVDFIFPSSIKKTYKSKSGFRLARKKRCEFHISFFFKKTYHKLL